MCDTNIAEDCRQVIMKLRYASKDACHSHNHDSTLRMHV